MVNRKRQLKILIFLALILLVSLLPVQAAQAQDGVVYAIIFYSPYCGHCHQIITEFLPPVFETYGEQFQLIGLDTTTPEGTEIYLGAIETFNIPDNRRGVPTLIIGDTVLVGSIEIPTYLTDLIDEHLAQGGVDFPAIPGLLETLEEMGFEYTDVSNPDNAATTETMTVRERIMLDPVGNIVSINALVGMLAALGVVGYQATRRRRAARVTPDWQPWLIPALTLIGFGIAVYLAYVETAQVEAVCGPVGDCNTVQQSDYARLFGILPIGVLGAMGYVVIGFTWLFTRLTEETVTRYARAALFGLTLFGTLFSIYLTFLEPFVIGATCMWCVSSAVIMTVLMLLTAPDGIMSLRSPSRRRSRRSTQRRKGATS